VWPITLAALTLGLIWALVYTYHLVIAKSEEGNVWRFLEDVRVVELQQVELQALLLQGLGYDITKAANFCPEASSVVLELEIERILNSVAEEPRPAELELELSGPIVRQLDDHVQVQVEGVVADLGSGFSAERLSQLPPEIIPSQVPPSAPSFTESTSGKEGERDDFVPTSPDMFASPPPSPLMQASPEEIRNHGINLSPNPLSAGAQSALFTRPRSNSLNTGADLSANRPKTQENEIIDFQTIVVEKRKTGPTASSPDRLNTSGSSRPLAFFHPYGGGLFARVASDLNQSLLDLEPSKRNWRKSV
jgi:hypothetical protein